MGVNDPLWFLFTQLSVSYMWEFKKTTPKEKIEITLDTNLQISNLFYFRKGNTLTKL